ncbi:MAG: hypothetical protein JF616_06520 [Fibrobacteres bacterium]|jgi:hypothetical protein|nr:hypothetical protein [Fibrobacterota bacterium]
MPNHFALRTAPVFALLIAFAPARAKDHPEWKSEKDFRDAAPMVHRQALWLEANPDAKTWGDSLKTVLTWAHDVPYANLGTAKVFEKEIQNLPKDPVAGRIASMMRVGFAEDATEPEFRKATEFGQAKAGVTCMIRYYENVKQAKPDYSIPMIERLAGLMHSDALDEYIQAKLRK